MMLKRQCSVYPQRAFLRKRVSLRDEATPVPEAAGVSEDVRAIQRLATEIKISLDQAMDDLAAASRDMNLAVTELTVQRQEIQAAQRALALEPCP